MTLASTSKWMSILAITPAFGAGTPPLSPELQPLQKAVGKWVCHGQNLQTPYTKAGKWEDCDWAANRIYVVCRFIMNWPAGPDHSLSVSTFNKVDNAYWHYEVIDDNKGSKPVALA